MNYESYLVCDHGEKVFFYLRGIEVGFYERPAKRFTVTAKNKSNFQKWVDFAPLAEDMLKDMGGITKETLPPKQEPWPTKMNNALVTIHHLVTSWDNEDPIRWKIQALCRDAIPTTAQLMIDKTLLDRLDAAVKALAGLLYLYDHRLVVSISHAYFEQVEANHKEAKAVLEEVNPVTKLSNSGKGIKTE